MLICDGDVVMDFEQWKFDLQNENNKAQEFDDPNYLGTWSRHEDDLKSWQILSGTSCVLYNPQINCIYIYQS